MTYIYKKVTNWHIIICVFYVIHCCLTLRVLYPVGFCPTLRCADTGLSEVRPLEVAETRRVAYRVLPHTTLRSYGVTEVSPLRG